MKGLIRTVLGVLLVALAGTWSCGDDDNSTGPDDSVVGDDSPTADEIPNAAVIYDAESLAAGDTVITASGLVYIELTAGAGRRAGRGSFVSVHYTGMLEDGTVFDSSYPRGVPFRFVLGQGVVIQGWDEGIALMLEGARGRLIIPPDLGYGQRGTGPIPGGATIVFDIWLANVD